MSVSLSLIFRSGFGFLMCLSESAGIHSVINHYTELTMEYVSIQDWPATVTVNKVTLTCSVRRVSCD